MQPGDTRSPRKRMHRLDVSRVAEPDAEVPPSKHSQK
jgi:hypothetical protein